jgi:hypothetical protein
MADRLLKCGGGHSDGFNSYNKSDWRPGSRTLKAQTINASASARIRSDASRGSEYSKSHPVGQKQKRQESLSKTTRVSETDFTRQFISTFQRRSSSSPNLISEAEFAHLWNKRREFSREENIFISCAESFGIREALYQAKAFHWPTIRVLAELMKARVGAA